jgi:hypothetical protein
MAVTVSASADGLNQFAVTKAQMIQQKLRTGLEIERLFTPRACDNTYSAPNATASEILQAYQWQFTAKGNVTLDAVENKLQKIKGDFVITADDLEKFWDTYMVEWHEIGKDPMEWSFPRYLYEEIFLPKIIEEMNHNAYNGSYTAPTPGTAGNSINSVDGLAKKIAAAVTASSLTEYATGAIVAGTMVDQVESWVDSLPLPYRDAPGVIYMSNTNAKYYWRNYRGEFGTGNGVAGNDNNELRVDATKKTIVGLTAMEGSDRFIFSPATTKNLIWGTRRGYPTMPAIRWEKRQRTIEGSFELYRFYGVEFWDHLFVNDQA